MSETKEDKFKRLAGKRVNVALDKIRIIGNLASPQYAFNSEQIESIMTALKAAIAEIEVKFQKPLQKSIKKFEI
ncbi:MAG: hypothetical protein V1882_08470 [Candidatus Omnitrophota bacterium]